MRAVIPYYNNNEEIRYGNKIKFIKMIYLELYDDDKCYDDLKIYEYTCKHKLYMMYEMYDMTKINEISPLTSS